MRAALQPGGVRWCPAFALTAQGPVHGVQGSPKCAAALAVATGALAHLSATGWGPPPARRQQAEAWRSQAEWAHSQLVLGEQAHEHHGASQARTSAAARLRELADETLWSRGRASNPKSAARALYHAAWQVCHGQQYRRWTADVSRGRRWYPGAGAEWTALAAAANMTAAGRVLRLLCNGAPGEARWRSAEQRAARTCTT